MRRVWVLMNGEPLSQEPAYASVSGQDVTDADLEGDRALAPCPAGVEDSAGGVVEEGQQDGDAAAPVRVGQLQGVHASTWTHSRGRRSRT